MLDDDKTLRFNCLEMVRKHTFRNPEQPLRDWCKEWIDEAKQLEEYIRNGA